MGALEVGIVERDPQRRSNWTTAIRHSESLLLGFVISELEPLADATDLGFDCDILVIGIDNVAFSSMRTWAALRLFFGFKSIVAITTGENRQIFENVLGVGVTSLLRPNIPREKFIEALVQAGKGEISYDPVLVERARRLFIDRPPEKTYTFGGLSIDLETRMALRWKQEIELTEQEFVLLKRLAEAGGNPVAVEELLEQVWGSGLGEGGTTDQVYSCIKRLRSKIEPSPDMPRYLLSVRGRGYRLANPYQAGDQSS